MNHLSLSHRFVAVICLLAGAGWVGCDIPDRPPLTPADIRPQLAGVTGEDRLEADPRPTVLEPPGEPFAGDWESWDAYLVRGRHVGYSHVVAKAAGPEPTDDVLYSLENRLYVRQGTTRLLQTLSQTSAETHDGSLIGFESVLQVGPIVTKSKGVVDEDQLVINSFRGSAQTQRKVPWQSTHRGMVALEQSLRQKPMTEKGARRALKMLLPGQYELATAQLECRGLASVPLIDGQLADLFEIRCEIQIEDGPANVTTIWTDQDGSIKRSFSPGLELVSYRTDEETATRLPNDDSVVASLAVSGEFAKPSESTRVAYQITPTTAAGGAETTVEIQPAPGQYVRKTDEGEIQILVSRRKEVPGKGFVDSDLVPTRADSQENEFIDFRVAVVRRSAEAVVASRNLTQTQVAVELTRHAHREIQEQTQQVGLQKASEVAFNTKGDVTGQAIFLAAMLRSRSIPSRLAIGVKYLPGDPDRMIYHVWTLAYIDGQWLQLDASEGRLAPADRLIFATTHLGEKDQYAALLPFFEAVRRIRILVLGQS